MNIKRRKKMKYILIKDVDGLGKAGDLVKAKQGYARNYLLPNNLAIEGTKENIKKWEEEQEELKEQEAENIEEAEKIKEDLESKEFVIKAKAGDGDRLFGSITNMDIADMLEEKGIDIDRKKIELKDPIRALGRFSVNVRLFKGVTAVLKIVVEKED